MSIELTEKYLQRIIITKSEVEEISEVNRKVKYLYQSLGRIEKHLKNDSSNEDLESHLEGKFEGMMQDEMALMRDRDSHLQFKVDRIKYKQERLEKNISYLFKIQVACIIFVFLYVLYILFSGIHSS